RGGMRLDLAHHRSEGAGGLLGHLGVAQHCGSFASGFLRQAFTALIAPLRVEIFTTRILSGSYGPPLTSSQLLAGARNRVAPALWAAASFCWMPPMSPTWPWPSISPVPATSPPPVSEPGVSVS